MDTHSNISHATQFNLASMQETIQELQAALLTAHPEMPQLLRKIHNKLKSDPELCTLLTEEEIAHVINGLKQQTQTEILSPAAKAKAAKPVTGASRINALLKKSNISADDF